MNEKPLCKKCQLWSFSWSVFSHILYLDTFHTVNLILAEIISSTYNLKPSQLNYFAIILLLLNKKFLS